MPLSVNLMATGPVADVVELARLAERLGYRRCWVYDEGLVTRDVYVTLTAIALATERIAVGPGITNPYVRHPGATAAAIATLDEVSGGRAFLGLGAGGGLTLGPLAVDRTRPVATVEAMVSSLRRLWNGEAVTQQADNFGFDRATMSYGRRDLEIILAGRGPRMVALGGQVADGFYLSYLHRSSVGPTIDRLRRARRDLNRGSGSDPDRPFTVVYSTMIATDDAEFEEARAQLSFRLVDSPPEVKRSLGMTAADEAAIRAALADGGPRAAAAHVDPSWVGEFVIVGSPAECGATLTALMEEHGIDEFLLPVPDMTAGAALIERTATLLG